MADEVDRTIGANLKRLRTEAGLKQSELVERLRASGLGDWHATTLSRTENGERPLRLAEAERLAGILDADVGEFVARGPGSGVLRDLERATLDLHLHGVAIVNAVTAYLDQQEKVAAIVEVLPPLRANAEPADAERYRRAVEAAEYELSIPYQWHADEALVPDDEARRYDPELDGKGWFRGVDPEAS